MRTKRAKSRKSSCFANVIESLESRLLLTGIGDVVGDTLATATNLGVLSAVSPFRVFGTIDEAFDRDVYQFQASASETTTVSLAASFSSLDTVVTLLDSLGNVIASNDDRSLFSTDSLLTATITGGATYFVEARGFSRSSGDFALTISLDAGDTIGTATDLGVLTTAQSVVVFGAIEQAFDRDVFSFQSNASGLTLVELNANFSSLDTVVTIFDSLGNVIATNDDITDSDVVSRDSSLRFLAVGGADYFVEARGFGRSVGDYRLSLTLAPDLGTLTLTQPLAVFDVIENPFDRDVFQFQAATSGTILVELSADHSSLDSFVTVLNSAGMTIASNDDIQPGILRNSRLAFAAQAGETYFVQARGFNDSVGDYRLNLTLFLDVGDTIQTAQSLGVVTAAQPLETVSVVNQAFDRDVFQFQVAATGSTVVELNRGSGFLDAFVTVLDSSGNVIAFDDDSGPGLNSRLVFVAEAGVTYFVEARGFGSSVGEYLLRIARDVGFPVASATNLGNLTGTLRASGRFEASEVHDLFLFTATRDGLVEVQESASASDFFLLDSFLQAFDVDSSFPIATDFGDFDTTIPRVVNFPVVAGHSYFAEVTGYPGSVGNYDLSIALLAEIGDTIGDAEDLGHLTVSAPLEFSSRIDTPFDRDVFMFQADASGTTVVALSADFSFLDTVASVFDSLGHVIATNDDIDLDAFVTDSRLVFTAVAGQTYFVEARGFGRSTGDYLLRILPSIAPRDVGNLTTTATAARPLMTSGILEPLEIHDLFVFTAASTGLVQVSQTAAPVAGVAIPFHGVLFAFNTSTGAPIAVDFGSPDATVPRIATFAVMAGQTYLAEITSFEDSSGGYQLNFNYVSDDVPQAGVNFEFPSRTGTIEVSGDIDTYRFTADTDQALQISLDAASGSFLDPVLNVRIFANNDLTTPLGTFRNDDFGFSFNSFLFVPMVRQGQVVEVNARGFSSSRGRYNLTIVAANGNAVVTNLVAGNSVIGSIETPFSTDTFRFMAESSGVATIDVTSFDSPGLPLGAIGDPLVTIRETRTGNFVAFDDDSGPGLNSLATFAVTAGTQYDFVVGGFGFRTGNYRVTLSTNAGDDGGTFDQATALSFDNNSLTINRDGRISPPPTNRPADVDVDVFSFMASSNGTLRVSVTPTSPGLQAGLSVFQASPTGNTADVELLAVAVPPLAGSGNASVREVFVPVTQGRSYFFRVSGLNGSVGNYSLSVEDQNDPVPGEAPGTVLDLDRITGIGTPTNPSDQSINFRSDRDWYRVIAPAIGEFTINLDQAPGSTLDPLLTIYNGQGLAILRNDDTLISDGVSSLNSRLTLQASRANEMFFVEAAGINETTGDYRLTVQFTAQAADDFGNDVGHSSVISEGPPGRFTRQGLLEASQDRDFFAFTAVVGGSFNLQLVTPNRGALPAGVEVQVFEVEATSLSAVSLDNLTRVASITSRGGELALNLPGDNSTIAIQRSRDDIQRSPDDRQPIERHFLVAVSNTGTAANIGYEFSINVTPGVASQNLQLQNAALFALVSLADGAAAMGDRSPDAINAAMRAAMNELGKSGSFLVVLLDPVNDPILTDSAGRTTGFMSNTGTLSGISGGYASVGGYGQVLIVPVNLSSPGSVSLQFAGVGSLNQAMSSFSAFVVGPTGATPVTQSSPSMPGGVKGNFVVQLGFGDTVIPTSRTASGPQVPSFFMMTNLTPNDLRTPSIERQTVEDIRIAQTDEDEDAPPKPPEPGFWIKVLEEVLHILQNGIDEPTLVRLENGLRQSIDRLSEQDSGMDVPVELLKSTAVGRSTKAIFDVLKHSAGWFRNTKPATPPIPKQRTPSPKVTLESASPKMMPQARLGSKKMTHLGG